MKSARILDGDEDDDFTLEEATTYEKAIREAKSFLGINEDNCDEDGESWEVS
jgi:hypothetical protein